MINGKGKGKGHIFCHSYSEGMVAGIISQMNKAKEEIRQEAITECKTSALAILDNRVNNSRKFAYDKFKLSTYDVKSNSKVDTSAYFQGAEKGRSLHL